MNWEITTEKSLMEKRFFHKLTELMLRQQALSVVESEVDVLVIGVEQKLVDGQC